MSLARDRARAALSGLAVGDALGMPTQAMSRADISRAFGRLDGFRPAAPDHPIAAGLAAGSVTDDTQQALLLARLLITGGGHVDPHDLAAGLLTWEDEMRAAGSADLLGPSTKRAIEALGRGEPVTEAGRFGVTNGASMRVTPVGIAVSARDLTRLVDRVVEACLVSHNTGVAIAGAAAVAAAVSAGLDGASPGEATAVAMRAAALGADRGHWVAAADVSLRIGWAVALADPARPAESLTDITALIGTSLATSESVAAAFGVLAVFPDDVWQACLAAARLGGDTDTMAAIVGAVGGATCGPQPAMAQASRIVEAVNGLDLSAVADALLRLRDGGGM